MKVSVCVLSGLFFLVGCGESNKEAQKDKKKNSGPISGITSLPSNSGSTESVPLFSNEEGVLKMGDNQSPDKFDDPTDLVLPSEVGGEAVTTIASGAFSDSSNLTSVVIPNTVTNIGDGAFYNNANLKSVTIPNSVKSIGSGAFYACVSLTEITIPASVTNISEMAFLDCKNLKKVTFLGKPPVLKQASTIFENTSVTIYYDPKIPGWGANFAGRACEPME